MLEEGERAFRLGVPAKAGERRAFPNRDAFSAFPASLSFASREWRTSTSGVFTSTSTRIHPSVLDRVTPRISVVRQNQPARRRLSSSSELSPLVDSDSKHTCRSVTKSVPGRRATVVAAHGTSSSGATTYRGVASHAKLSMSVEPAGSSGNRSRSSPAPTTRFRTRARARQGGVVFDRLFRRGAGREGAGRVARGRTSAVFGRGKLAGEHGLRARGGVAHRGLRGGPKARETRGDRGDRVGVGGRFAVGHLVAGGVRVGVLVGASAAAPHPNPPRSPVTASAASAASRSASLAACSAASAADRTTASISSDAASGDADVEVGVVTGAGSGRSRARDASTSDAGVDGARWPIGEVGAGGRRRRARRARRWGNRRWPSSRARGGRGGGRRARRGWSGRSWRGAGCRPTGEIILSHRRVLVFASLVGARRRTLADPMAPSGASGSPSAEGVDSDPARVRYLAFLLDDVSRCSLLDWVAELSGGHPGADDDGWTVHADHVTVAHRDASGFDAALASFPWGMACEMRVLGIAGDARARGPRRGARLRAPSRRGGAPRHRRVRPRRARRRVRRHARRGHRVRRVPRHLRGCPAHPHRKTRRRHRRGRPRLPTAHAPRPRRGRLRSAFVRARRDVRPTSERERVAHLWRQLDALATTTDDDDDSNRGWLSAGAPGGYLTVARRLDASRDPVPANPAARPTNRDEIRTVAIRTVAERNTGRPPVSTRRTSPRIPSWTRWRGRSRTRRATRARATLAECGWAREPSRRGFALRRGRGGLLRAGTRR